MSSHSLHETSSVLVDPVTRAISCTQQGAPAQSDASKVVAKGLGLSKGFVGQKNSFSVDCSKAGTMYLRHIKKSLLVLNWLFVQQFNSHV